jgi:tetratricopeptide (TPR) repeat protein
VEKFIGDAVMAVFGVPAAREDDAVRAVRAAAEMQRRVADLNRELERRFGCTIAVRIGVNSGEVVTGEATAREALVTGDAVNVAARLEQAARPGEVLLGAATYRLARRFVEAEQVDPVVAKGKAEPVAAYRVVDVAAAASARTPSRFAMVGRKQELAMLETALAGAVRARRCELRTVVGEPGVGKSRLADEFADRVVESDAARVLRGRCLSYGEGITFWPIAEIVRAVAGVRDGDDVHGAREQVFRLVADAPQAELVADRVAQAIGLTGGSAPTEEIAWAIRKFLEALARHQPLVVVIDDIQWAEPALLDVLADLPALMAGAPIVVICLARPELVEDRPEWTPVTRLDPLTSSESSRLVEALLGASEVPAGVLARIDAAAAGNPLFAEELVAMLVELGVLRRRGSAWVATGELAELQIPATVAALLESRLDLLPPPVRRTLACAAVEGQEFHRGAVLALTPEGEREAVDAEIETLLEKGLVHEAPSSLGQDAAFRFRHVLIRDAAYRGLPKKVRADLHERFARWLDGAAGERRTELEEVLGHHLESAFRLAAELGPVDAQRQALAGEAARHLAAAGRRAADRGDMPAAAKLLARSVALNPPEAEVRRELLVEVAGARVALGELERAEAHLQEAIDAARSADDLRTQWRARVAHGVVRGALRGESAADVDEAETAAAALEEIGDELGTARAWLWLGQLHFWRGAAARATTTWGTALRHARRARSRIDESEILSWLLICSWFGPEPVEHGMSRCEAILAEDTHDRRTIAQAHVEYADFLAALGRIDRAREHLRQGEAIIDDLGLTLLAGIVSQEAFDLEMLAGDAFAAERVVRRGCELLEAMGEKGFLDSRLTCLADALYVQGRNAEAEEVVARVEADGSLDDVDVQWRWRAVRAKILARRGEAVAAQALAAEAVRLLEPTDWLGWKGASLLDQCEVLRLADRGAEALAAAHRALACFEQKGNVVFARRAAAAAASLASAGTGPL